MNNYFYLDVVFISSVTLIIRTIQKPLIDKGGAMPSNETVASYTHRLERLLKEKYHATGEGLPQLTESSVSRIPHSAVQKLRYIADVNQNLLDGDSYELEDEAAFFRVCVECEKELTPRSGRFVWGMAILLMVIITVAALLFYSVHWDMLTEYIN